MAERRYKDDIPEDVKKRRLQEIVDVQYQLSLQSNKDDVGITTKVLIEGESKRSESDWMGRNSQNKVVVFPKTNNGLQKGSYAWVKVESCTKGTLIGQLVEMV